MNEINKIQELLKQNHITYYVVPTDDDHQSEMVGDYYQFRKYLSHFTGSAGTLLISQDKAYLWTDGRYFIQAKEELPEEVELMKMRMPGTPTILEFLATHLQEGDSLGFDGSVTTAAFILDLEESIDFSINYKDIDLTSVWENRPERSHEPVFIYEENYSGESVKSKLSRLRDVMNSLGCQSHLISSLDDICWLFNIRGHDIECSPVVLSFSIVTLDKAILYLQEGTYSQDIINYYQQYGVIIKDYEQVYQDVSKINDTLLVNLEAINFKLFSQIHTEIVEDENPTQQFKSIKNETEIKCSQLAHLKDGLAVTQFMYWLKNHPLENETEISIADKLETFRKKQEHYLEPSFTTICAYKENGAIIHYHATKEHNSFVYNKGLLMIDSGGQYLEGTTDITRTFVLGELSPVERRDFTLVLKGFLQLMNSVFPHGTNGMNLDTYARAALWKYGLNFNHGTGHGVGHFLNVHEGPQGIRTYDDNSAVFEPGMITSDEPGIYVENSHGIRHENLLLCVVDKETDFGTFLKFEPLTLVPIDLDGIDLTLLTQEEKDYLNHYHQRVYSALSPYLTDKENEWLKEYTRNI